MCRHAISTHYLQQCEVCALVTKLQGDHIHIIAAYSGHRGLAAPCLAACVHFTMKTTAIYSVRHGLHTIGPMSTQPSTLCGTVK